VTVVDGSEGGGKRRQEIVDLGSSGQNPQTENMPTWVSIRLEQKKWIGLWKRPLKDDGLGLEGRGDCEC